jgi:hypothetical protein
MRTVTDDERKTATLIPLDSILSDMDDTEAAFNGFRESFQTGEEPGVVRAWELMIDERGNIGTTRTQTRLGSWPVDAYTMDELCKMLIDQYMTPDQIRMAVRLVGTDPRKSGFAFNKIVMLKRAIKKESSSEPKDSTASILKMMQEMNERNMQMLQRLTAQPAEKPDTMAELQKMMVFAQSMNAPMMTMLSQLLPALAGRPAPATASDPFGSLDSLLNVAERISDMRGGGGGGGDDDSVAGIIRSIVPLAKPALEALPALAAMQAANRPAPRVLPAPAPVRAAPPSPTATPTPPPVAQPAPTGPTILATDIPSGDSAMLAQLKPQIDSLVSMAEQGSDPTGAADLIFDQVFLDPRLPDELYEKLADFVDSEQFVNYVTIMNPGAKPHAAWFQTFKAQIVKRFAVEDAEAGSAPTVLEPPPHHPV